MTTDLWCVVGISLWGLLFTYVPVLGRLQKAGVAWGFGNRDGPLPEVSAWVLRAERAFVNHLGNLTPFVAIVLVAHVSGKADDVTATASIVFVISRVLHSLLYVAGVAYVRTLAFWASLGAIGVIVSRLL